MACELAFRLSAAGRTPTSQRLHRSSRPDRHVDGGSGGWGRQKTRYSPVNSGLRFSNIALMPSPRSRDGRNAEFHAAT